jgi:hypothetical protein
LFLAKGANDRRHDSGRFVAGYFEELLPRQGNEDYYAKTRMPISLKTIERRLHNQEFATLAQLESYFKRMVTNAKEFYHKNTEVFEDAERVRKALSNYMTRTNPAYKLIPGYSCQATPIPAEPEPEAGEEPAVVSGAMDAKTEDDAKRDEHVDDEEDADGEEDAEGDEDEEEEDQDGEGEGEDEEEDEEDDEDGGTRRIIIKRRGGGRPGQNGSVKTDRQGRAKADHEYEGVAYKGLTFQQAQEKIVEELIRKPDGS